MGSEPTCKGGRYKGGAGHSSVSGPTPVHRPLTLACLLCLLAGLLACHIRVCAFSACAAAVPSTAAAAGPFQISRRPIRLRMAALRCFGVPSATQPPCCCPTNPASAAAAPQLLRPPHLAQILERAIQLRVAFDALRGDVGQQLAAVVQRIGGVLGGWKEGRGKARAGVRASTTAAARSLHCRAAPSLPQQMAHTARGHHPALPTPPHPHRSTLLAVV